MVNTLFGRGDLAILSYLIRYYCNRKIIFPGFALLASHIAHSWACLWSFRFSKLCPEVGRPSVTANIYRALRGL